MKILFLIKIINPRSRIFGSYDWKKEEKVKIFLCTIVGLYPLWVMVGQLILNNVQDEVIVEIDVSYAITPLCIIISFFTGLCIKYAFPICKKYASSAVVEVSSIHFLIFLAISLVCVDFRKLAYPGKSMEYTNVSKKNIQIETFSRLKWICTHLQFLIAGTILSIIGCCSGWLMALIFRMDYVDRLAIATESITQNKGNSQLIIFYIFFCFHLISNQWTLSPAQFLSAH